MHGQLFQNGQELTHLEHRLCQVWIRRRGDSLLYARREQRLHTALHVKKVFSQDTKATYAIQQCPHRTPRVLWSTVRVPVPGYGAYYRDIRDRVDG